MADEPVTTTQGDVWSTRLVVVCLAVVLIVGVAGMIGLPLIGKEAPDAISNIVNMLIGVLAAILTPLAVKAK